MDPPNLVGIRVIWEVSEIFFYLSAFGIVAITQIRTPGVALLPTLALVPVPALFYIATVRFSNPENFISDSNREGTTIYNWALNTVLQLKFISPIASLELE